MEGFWQDFSTAPAVGPAYGDRYSVMLGERVLDLPIRPLPQEDKAVASLIANQASFAVIDQLTEAMADLAAGFQPDVVVGLPTLGLTFAPGIARALGHPNYVPLGYSRKFWYRDDLSVPISSITSPDAEKQLFIDPLILPRIAGRRVLVVDDVASTGRSLLAVAKLLAACDVTVAGAVVAMRQGAHDPAADPFPIAHVFTTPRFTRRADGWWPER
ncbi:phosphoribosyltransferase [Acidisoma cellulosilytica]|uniref:Phosphoribosyltransferase n=1 Tax=Acidisoma cellulosilyticum TaxID=2802395 RepID=A0A964E2U1_9PROT|nr:phosphoribosyltransferase [Acidisoma cellulosilyticum]MCB8879990.1 phosphoribosyltransferase [Acidisoma cellulosilyticum]